MILLDTGFFLALFNPDDALHHRALAYDLHFEQAGFEALLRKDPPA